MSSVLSVWVRSVDAPQFVAETEADLSEGDTFGLEQCDACGGSLYTAVMHGGRWFLRCTRDDEQAEYEGLPEGVGCGQEYPVTYRDEEEVAF